MNSKTPSFCFCLIVIIRFVELDSGHYTKKTPVPTRSIKCDVYVSRCKSTSISKNSSKTAQNHSEPDFSRSQATRHSGNKPPLPQNMTRHNKIFAPKWTERLYQLFSYRMMHGHCNPNRSNGLGKWLASQESLFRRGNLSSEKVRRLVMAGVVHSRRKMQWKRSYSCLLYCRLRYGHCNVNASEDHSMAKWVLNVRTRKKNGLLTQNQIETLESIGFLWKVRVQNSWEQSMRMLLEYRMHHGHNNVSAKMNRSLALWTRRQVKLPRRALLRERRLQKLQSVNMKSGRRPWQYYYEQAVLCRMQRGHCNIKRTDDDKLYKWIQHQRFLYRCARLDPMRMRMLRRIGFRWAQREAWSVRYGELISYAAAYGNCSIPWEWPENPLLARWMMDQRNLRRCNRLSAERIRQLDAVGFIWARTSAKAWWSKTFSSVSFSKNATVAGDCPIAQINSLQRECKLPTRGRKVLLDDSIRQLWIPCDETGAVMKDTPVDSDEESISGPSTRTSYSSRRKAEHGSSST